ncbi:MAG TPA: hypothetical protein V6D14_27460 [Coleofasciculaceae cyanobacterium]|jgi:hypothetical protein
MGLDIKVGDLASRAIRQKVTPGGIKRIATKQYKEIKNSDGGVIGFLLDTAGRFFGFLFKSVFGIAQWALSTIWGWVCSAVQFIWRFNWAASDEDLDKNLATALESFGGTLGGALGNALGFITVGAVGGAIIFSFNEALAVHALNEFGEEALEEISSNAAAVIRVGFQLGTRYLFTWAYKALRTAIGLNPDAIYLSDADIAKKVADKEWTQDMANKNKKGRDALKAQNKRKPWSFALKWEEFVESIDNKFLKNFVEEFFEEFFEAVQEGGYVLTSSMDSYYAQNSMANRAHHAATSQEATVMVQLNRPDNPATPTTP